MPYQSFTVTSVEERFGLTLTQTNGHFADVPPVAPTDFLVMLVKRHAPLVSGTANEKPRSELLISPILIEVREQLDGQVAVFSGELFNVDKKNDLYGYCDFLICRDPLIAEVRAPVAAVAEAKREDLNEGTAQCIAGMIAAQKFNEKRGKPVSPLFGVLSSGTNWRFLQLDDKAVTIDLRNYSLAELPEILGVLIYMASGVHSGRNLDTK